MPWANQPSRPSAKPTEAQRLSADLAGGEVDDPVTHEIPGLPDRRLDAVRDERQRRGVRETPVVRRRVGDDEDVLARGRRTASAVGLVDEEPTSMEPSTDTTAPMIVFPVTPLPRPFAAGSGA